MRIDDIVAAIKRSDGHDLGPLDGAYRAELLTAPEVRLNPAVDELPLEPHRSLLGWWADHRDATGLPSAGMIAPDQLRAFLGRLIVLEPVAREDFRYRLYGSTIAQFVGMDLTGKLFSETHDVRVWPALTTAYFLATYRASVEARQPLYTAEGRPGSTSPYFWHRLLLPFGDAGGQVTRVLLYTVPCGEDGVPLPAWLGGLPEPR